MGEEWRRGWHPDRIARRHADESILIVGAGPAGLEAACALGQRGYEVTLAEAQAELGGRINSESRLPGLSEYARVRDWRQGQLARMANVRVYPDNRLDADAILGFESQHVIVATGARWRTDGVGRWSNLAFTGCEHENVIGLDKILNGFLAGGQVVIYDDDHYYLGSAVALQLAARGAKVTLVTPATAVAGWSQHTEEHSLTMKALIEAGVEIVTASSLVDFEVPSLRLACIFSGIESSITAEYLIPISARIPNDELWRVLDSRRAEFSERGGLSLQRIGDCHAPGLVAAAVYAGHKAARELGRSTPSTIKRDRVVL